MGVAVNELLEGHCRNHRGIAQSLQLHMSPVIGPFELDDHQVGIGIDAQQVDTPGTVDPVTEFLGDDHQALIEDADLLAQHPLDVIALRDAFGAKSRFCDWLQLFLADLKDGHVSIALHGSPYNLSSRSSLVLHG